MLALIALMVVSAVADSPAHFHLKQPPSSCDLCYVAHLVSCGTDGTQPLQAPLAEARNTPATAFFSYERIARNSSFSRGPPAFSL